MNLGEPNPAPETKSNGSTRREFIGTAAAGVALASAIAARSYAATDNTIQIALIGCGGRGAGAALNAMNAKNAPVKLVAMADVFPAKLQNAYNGITKQRKDQVDVPENRQFIGFDAYKKAMDCLRPGDIAILTTPPAFRWPHFTYAIEKGLNVFMEKPIAVDAPSTRRMIALADAAKQKNLKVGVGLMCRHCVVRQELLERIQDGAIGEIVAARSYRMHGPGGYFASKPKPQGISDLMYQVQRFHSFLWASGGCFSDFYIHNIDEVCWAKGSWPVKAHGSGGRHYREDNVDQNFDTYTVEYTFADGAPFFYEGRCITGANPLMGVWLHGSKRAAKMSGSGHTPAGSCIFKDQDTSNTADLKWSWKKGTKEPNPYDREWVDLIDAIINNKPYNEVERGAMASLVTAMGRKASHICQVVTLEDMLKDEHEFAPDVDKFAENSPAPLKADADGKYPIPTPGMGRKEYSTEA
ncbi:MAG TPA: Gfo/Idh/MocA family oxidoreductase [Planctomycetota bacterium]|jgi:predicted dehydrogenase